MAASDIFSGAGSGAATGASAGALFGPKGAAIGAAGGALFGGIGGWLKGRGRDKQKKTLAEAQRRIAALRAQQRQQREMDLERAMALFSPVDDEMTRLYG